MQYQLILGDSFIYSNINNYGIIKNLNNFFILKKRFNLYILTV